METLPHTFLNPEQLGVLAFIVLSTLLGVFSIMKHQMSLFAQQVGSDSEVTTKLLDALLGLSGGMAALNNTMQDVKPLLLKGLDDTKLDTVLERLENLEALVKESGSA